MKPQAISLAVERQSIPEQEILEAQEIVHMYNLLSHAAAVLERVDCYLPEDSECREFFAHLQQVLPTLTDGARELVQDAWLTLFLPELPAKKPPATSTAP